MATARSLTFAGLATLLAIAAGCFRWREPDYRRAQVRSLRDFEQQLESLATDRRVFRSPRHDIDIESLEIETRTYRFRMLTQTPKLATRETRV